MFKNILKDTPENIKKAAELIQKGGLVAFPTETVYGLGASVLNPKAVATIFEVKGRPTFNPLISHIADINFLEVYAVADKRALALANKFWPGPLTFVLKRQESNPALDLVCAGLNTITVRMPNHPTALKLIKACGVPIAAPSANRSQTISPTTAKHVAESLGERVGLILDGGPCEVGVESTILDLTRPQAVLLRAGGLGLETLEDFLNEKIEISDGNPDKPSSPGQLLKHYAPDHPLRINVLKPEPDEFYIGFGKCEGAQLNLSRTANVTEAAANLFAYLRKADKQTEFKKIAMAPIPQTGLGLAINDRIKRASYQK